MRAVDGLSSYDTKLIALAIGDMDMIEAQLRVITIVVRGQFQVGYQHPRILVLALVRLFPLILG